jgi:hypothetical protein
MVDREELLNWYQGHCGRESALLFARIRERLQASRTEAGASACESMKARPERSTANGKKTVRSEGSPLRRRKNGTDDC